MYLCWHMSSKIPKKFVIGIRTSMKWPLNLHVCQILPMGIDFNKKYWRGCQRYITLKTFFLILMMLPNYFWRCAILSKVYSPFNRAGAIQQLGRFVEWKLFFSHSLVFPHSLTFSHVHDFDENGAWKDQHFLIVLLYILHRINRVRHFSLFVF